VPHRPDRLPRIAAREVACRDAGKFGLDFRVVDTAYIKQLRRDRGIHANPWTSIRA
jgi:hypothetical protein